MQNFTLDSYVHSYEYEGSIKSIQIEIKYRFYYRLKHRNTRLYFAQYGHKHDIDV